MAYLYLSESVSGVKSRGTALNTKLLLTRWNDILVVLSGKTIPRLGIHSLFCQLLPIELVKLVITTLKWERVAGAREEQACVPTS